MKEFELSINRRFDAPVKEVFRLWSDPALRKQWWGPKDFTCTALASDFRPGGAWSASIRSASHGEYGMSGTYTGIVENESIAFTFFWSDEPEKETTVTVSFAPAPDGGTRQRFHQAPYDTEASRDSHLSGWNECIDRLEAFTATQMSGALS